MCLVRVCRGIWILFLLFVGKNKVILGSDVRLVRVFQGIWIGRSGVLWGAPGCSGAPPGRFLYIFNQNSIRKPPESALVGPWWFSIHF